MRWPEHFDGPAHGMNNPEQRGITSRGNQSSEMPQRFSIACSLRIPITRVAKRRCALCWPDKRAAAMRTRPWVSVYFYGVVTRFRRMPLEAPQLLMTDSPSGGPTQGVSIPLLPTRAFLIFHGMLAENRGSSADGREFASFGMLI